MNLFKKKENERGNPYGRNNQNWWNKVVALYRKDIDKDVDPEKEVQKIYQHWIKSYLCA